MKPRVARALNAMVALGILREEARKALKRLYCLYEKNWEFIEAENYRALIDAIFEDKEEGEEGPTKEREANGESCTVNGNSSDHLEREFDESVSNKQCLTLEESNASPRVDNHQEASLPLVLGVQPQPYCLTNLEDDTSGFDSSSKKKKKYSRPSTSTSEIRQDLGRECSSFGRTTGQHYTVDVATCKEGDVKLSLMYDRATGQSFTHSPNMESVLHQVEGKFLRSHMRRDPLLSLSNILRSICEHFSVQCKVSTSGVKALCNRSRKDERMVSADRALTLTNVENERKLQQRSIDDISKGKEKVKISLVDESGKADIPSFFYTPQNIVYQNAHVSISLARISDDDSCPACVGDCLSSPVPCACARETGGEFAYTSPDGVLKEEFLNSCISLKQDPQKHHYVYCQDCPLERAKNDAMPDPCKGHLLRRFVKECWSKCGCDMQCGNRVVQRGISRSLQVFWTGEEKGWGLRCTEGLPKGAFVCEYIGEVMTNTELYERNLQNSKKRHTYPVNLDADWGSESILKDEEALCLDATDHGNVARFINHRCYDSNLLDIPVEVETLDRHYYHLAFFTTKEVHAYQELTWDYSIDFNDRSHPIEAFQCRCGSQLCRGSTSSLRSKGKRKVNS